MMEEEEGRCAHTHVGGRRDEDKGGGRTMMMMVVKNRNDPLGALGGFSISAIIQTNANDDGDAPTRRSAA